MQPDYCPAVFVYNYLVLMKKIVSILLIILPAIVGAQNKAWLSTQAQICLDKTYQFEYFETGSLDEDEIYYISAYHHFLQFVKDEDKNHLKSFEKEMNRLLKVAKVNNSKTTLMLVNLNVQLGLMQVMKGDQVTGVYTIYSAYKTFTGLDEAVCNSLEYQKLNGLFLILADQVQAQSSFMSWLLGIKGDEKLGFQLLHSYVTQNKHKAGLYSEGLLMMAYFKLQFDEMDQTDLRRLIQEGNRLQSPILSFVASLNAFKNNQTALLKTSMQNWNDEFEEFPLLRYVKGRLLLNDLNSEGINELRRFITDSNGSAFKADANFRLARFFHMKGETDKRDAALNDIKQLKNISTALDKQAIAEMPYLRERPEVLTKTRFLFDNSDYLTVISLLNTVTVNSCSAFYQVEWWYRQARAEELLDNYDVALKLYDKVIALSVDDDRYYGPYSALFATHLSIVQGQRERANYYLNKAEELNTGEYKKEISIKIDDALKNR